MGATGGEAGERIGNGCGGFVKAVRSEGGRWGHRDGVRHGGGGHGAGGGGGWNGFLVGMMKERMTFHARRGD